jgi:nitroreductase
MISLDALTALQTRVSCALLEDPGPSSLDIDELIKAACRAPDHAGLKPWRFILIEGDSRVRFGDLLAKANHPGTGVPDPTKVKNAQRKAHRAPSILVVVARITEHPKVPEIEQIISAGAAANNIVTAAFIMGIGAYWRTGSAAFSPVVKQGLGLSINEQIVGFIYLGTPRISLNSPPEINPQDYLTRW